MVKAELARKSEFFRKMFDAASKPDQPESVPLAESSKVLQVVLATCMGDKYGAPKIPCDQRDSDFWRMAKCFNKYGVGISGRSIRRSCNTDVSPSHSDDGSTVEHRQRSQVMFAF